MIIHIVALVALGAGVIGCFVYGMSGEIWPAIVGIWISLVCYAILALWWAFNNISFTFG